MKQNIVDLSLVVLQESLELKNLAISAAYNLICLHVHTTDFRKCMEDIFMQYLIEAYSCMSFFY